ncbi:putative nucleoside-diphosphate kinase [Lupinus albus]|uniref:nucleoside-diphosphate kinase n=1 Tax=Lupinus albus TaxID=3870 RepID=A0A6A4NF18_LUPAL|nr:putative nucleoside-diphosphate kinase [Lupinus albus]
MNLNELWIVDNFATPTVERAFVEKHYADLSAKPFFNGLLEYIISGPVEDIGAIIHSQSEPETIRGDFAIEIGRNVILGSDSVESATKEIALWFPDGPTAWQSALHSWIYE